MPKRLQVYDTPGITVTFDPNICRHTGVCVRGLPNVFDVRIQITIVAHDFPATVNSTGTEFPA